MVVGEVVVFGMMGFCEEVFCVVCVVVVCV